ncbi:hypothetical protein Tco_0723548 [Tanacetum coccineum]
MPVARLPLAYRVRDCFGSSTSWSMTGGWVAVVSFFVLVIHFARNELHDDVLSFPQMGKGALLGDGFVPGIICQLAFSLTALLYPCLVPYDLGFGFDLALIARTESGDFFAGYSYRGMEGSKLPAVLQWGGRCLRDRPSAWWC